MVIIQLYPSLKRTGALVSETKACLILIGEFTKSFLTLNDERVTKFNLKICLIREDYKKSLFENENMQ